MSSTFAEIAALAESLASGLPAADKETEKAVDSMMFALTAPTIVWPGYEDAVGDLKDKVQLSHLAKMASKVGYSDEMATDWDCCVYLHTASFVNPMGPEWLHVYMHVFSKCMGEKAAQALGDDVNRPLEPQEEQLLMGLRRWIYRQQMKAFKAKQAK